MMQAVKTVGSTGLVKSGQFEGEAVYALRRELEKGIRSAKNGEVYSVEEAWEEIDKIQGMERRKKYKVLLSKDALMDIKETKQYILTTFKYRGYAENFSKKIKKAIQQLDTFPTGYGNTGYKIEGLEVYYRPYGTYLIFFVVENEVVIVIRSYKL